MKRYKTLGTMFSLFTILLIVCVIAISMSIYTLHITDVPIDPTEPIVGTESTIEATVAIETEPIVETEPITETEPMIVETEPMVVETEPQRWWTDEELDMLAALIYYESGSSECSDRHQQLVGQVVINRMNSDKYPNTIYNVITQSGQYSPAGNVLQNMGNRNIIPQRCYDNALVVLNGDVDCPQNVLYQANFRQGSGVYEEIRTSYSTSYFCYG